ncbi:MAG: hypothetical protein PHI35_06030 [Victivallaceae bacterium]|nr:hypothetical protein [Victivallaceae bacterium]
MKSGKILAGAASAVVLMLANGGCDDSRPPLLVKGDRLRNSGDAAGAEQFYLRYLNNRPSATAHLALATLYDEDIDRPQRALYHYEEYLRLAASDDPARGEAERYLDLLRGRLAAILNGRRLPGDAPRRESELLRENAALKTSLANLEKKVRLQQRKLEELNRLLSRPARRR